MTTSQYILCLLLLGFVCIFLEATAFTFMKPGWKQAIAEFMCLVLLIVGAWYMEACWKSWMSAQLLS